VLDTDSEDYAVGDKVLLKYQGQDLAVFTVESKWLPNKPLEAKNCYGTTSIEHPAVQMISMERGKYYMGEHITAVHLFVYCFLRGDSSEFHTEHAEAQQAP